MASSITPAEKLAQEEAAILKSISDKKRSCRCRSSQGCRVHPFHRDRLESPAHIRKLTEEEQDDVRNKWHIIVEGVDIPPPIKTFGR